MHICTVFIILVLFQSASSVLWWRKGRLKEKRCAFAFMGEWVGNLSMGKINSPGFALKVGKRNIWAHARPGPFVCSWIVCKDSGLIPSCAMCHPEDYESAVGRVVIGWNGMRTWFGPIHNKTLERQVFFLLPLQRAIHQGTSMVPQRGLCSSEQAKWWYCCTMARGPLLQEMTLTKLEDGIKTNKTGSKKIM